MVSTKANKRKAVRKRKAFLTVGVIALLIIVAFGIYFALTYFVHVNDAINEPDKVVVEAESNLKTETAVPDKIDFQSVVDDWAGNVGGNRSVLIYDLERNEVAGKYNTTEDYDTASLYKLFVVYEGYKRLQSGEWQTDEPAGATGYTILKCLDLAIRESYSPCAETLWAKIGYDNLDAIIREDYDITDSDISHLVSNPEDIAKMMKVFYEHKDITDDNLIAIMKDSFLNQPPTTYNWRQGLPSGFTKANVYNKVGWDYNPDARVWNVYHDAAIVEFPDTNRHFIVVVMTNRVPFQKITELGGMIEQKTLNS